MKKILFLLSFATIASPVRAGTFEVDYGLDINSYYGYTDYSKPYNKMYKQNNLNSSFNAYGRITYEFNKEYAVSLVGYLMVDTAKEIENYNQGIWGEEIYSAIETPAGEFSVGQDYNVAYKFAVGAPNIGKFRINNTDIANFIINPNWYKKGSKMSYKTLNSTYINTDGASPKINYITPAWKGIKLGATFIPETYSQAGLVAKDAPYKDKSAYVLGAYGYWYLSGYELETSLGFADYDKNDKEYSAGISLYRKGWTLGASYRKTEAYGNDYAINKKSFYDAYREGRAYNIGLSYAIGPFTTGIAYFDSKADVGSRDKIVSFSNSWQYNKYTTFSFTAARLKAEGADSHMEEDSKGYAFIFGLELEL